jgi:F-type H+-transporting ATPase subunit h
LATSGWLLTTPIARRIFHQHHRHAISRRRKRQTSTSLKLPNIPTTATLLPCDATSTSTPTISHPSPPLPNSQHTNTPRIADFVQELYLKELKAYKPTPIKETDSVGQVATFNLPKSPKSPEEADLASSLKEYENMAVEVEGQEGAAAGQPAAVVEDWLVEEEEEETAHH